MKKDVNDIGIEAKAPKDACESEKCPWHGHLKIHGRIFTGKVVSNKPANTVIVSWNYYKYIPKYERYERRKTKIESHSPGCIGAKAGDTVRIGECRPVSKSKRFVVFEKVTS
ncbi:MAG: 30S ribosomal protein S17 [Candidatus Aenigmarchaeota archaeon]|nr:30S ribosomal protein S17 [Candidatus Aenigmarchaeota archaeon]MDI6722035.1 30S ribosomal protein S17 [Candidatus Aenigmarchaeota archaeon]